MWSEMSEQKRSEYAERMRIMQGTPDVQEKLRRHLLSDSNPFRSGEAQVRAQEVLRMKGYTMLSGGNGTGMTVPQAMLLAELGGGWSAEHIVRTRMRRRSGYPGHYKLDIASPEKMVCVEVDGNSHSTSARKAQDAKKDAFLASVGWTVLRVTNKEVLAGARHVASIILKLAQGTSS